MSPANPTTPVAASCSRRYRASRTSGIRQAGAVRWIVVHDGESPTAESMARFFANKAPPPPDGNGPAGSAHLCVDDNVCYRTLDNDQIPWAARSSIDANLHGFHIEQAGYARWSTVIWKRHWRTLDRAAYKTALHCLVFNVRPVFVFAAELPLHNGVTTHAEISKASRRLDPAHAARYSHSDPGPFWPRRAFMRRVREHYAALNV